MEKENEIIKEIRNSVARLISAFWTTGWLFWVGFAGKDLVELMNHFNDWISKVVALIITYAIWPILLGSKLAELLSS